MEGEKGGSLILSDVTGQATATISLVGRTQEPVDHVVPERTALHLRRSQDPDAALRHPGLHQLGQRLRHHAVRNSLLQLKASSGQVAPKTLLSGLQHPVALALGTTHKQFV